MPVSERMQGAFKGLKGTKPTVDALYYSPGHYWVRLDRLKEIETRKKDLALVVEGTVIRVVREEPGRSIRVGQCPSRMFMLGDDYFEADLVAFVGNMFGIDPASVSDTEAMLAFGDDSPLVNMVAEVEAREITTKKNTLFTKISFRGEVPPAVVLEQLPPADKNRFFPNQYLERMIAAMAQPPAQ